MDPTNAPDRELDAIVAIVSRLESDMVVIAAEFDSFASARLERFALEIGAATTDGDKLRLMDNLERDLTKLADKLYGPKSAFNKTYRSAVANAAVAGRASLGAAIAAAGEAAADIAGADVASIIKASRDSYALASRYLGQEAIAEIRGLITRELMAGAGEKQLVAALLDKGLIQDLDTGKRVIKAQTRAEMIARTEPRRISEESYRTGAAEVEPDPSKRLYKWVSVLGKTSGDDSFRRHGMVMTEEEWNSYSFGDNMYGFPPIRPNDRCSVIFMREAWLDESSKEALKAAPGTDERRFTQRAEEAMRLQLLNDRS